MLHQHQALLTRECVAHAQDSIRREYSVELVAVTQIGDDCGAANVLVHTYLRGLVRYPSVKHLCTNVSLTCRHIPLEGWESGCDFIVSV